jgi:hypothetical protein
MMEALRSSKTSVFTRAMQRNIQEDGILHCDVINLVNNKKHFSETSNLSLQGHIPKNAVI